MSEGDLVFKQAIAVIDKRTTLICVDAAGQIQPVNDPFTTLAGEYANPPFHIHCRTIVGVWMPGFVNDQRRLANAELKRRPKKVRDKRNYVNRIPGPVDVVDEAVDWAEVRTRWSLDGLAEARGPLSKAQYKAIDDWVQASQDFNEKVRAGKALKGKFAEMDDSLRSLVRPLDRPAELTRIVPGDVFGKFPEASDVVSDRGWATGAIDREGWLGRYDPIDWAGDDAVVMSIRCPPGTRGFHAGQLEGGARGGGFDEFVLEPGTQMRVVEVIEPDYDLFIEHYEIVFEVIP